MNWVDFAIAAMVLFGAWSGYRKGFLVAFSKLAGYILGFIGALAFYKPFAGFLGGTCGLEPTVVKTVARVVSLPDQIQQTPIQNLSLAKVQGVLDSMALPVMYKKQVGAMVLELGTITKRADVFTISDALYHLVAGVILQILAFIILIFLIELVTALILKGVASLMSYTPAGVLDKGAGLILGSTKSILVVTVMLAVVNPILSIGSMDQAGLLGQLSSGVQGSQFSSYLLTLIQGTGIFR